MLSSWVNKNLTSVISSTTTLIHVFIVILFFENYFLTFKNESLINLSLSFKEIKLTPFIAFFLFIAFTKVIWLFIHIIRTTINKFIVKNTISSHNSFITFTLAILIGYYLYISDDYLELFEQQYFIYTRVFKFFCTIVMATCSLIYFLHMPEGIFGNNSNNEQ